QRQVPAVVDALESLVALHAERRDARRTSLALRVGQRIEPLNPLVEGELGPRDEKAADSDLVQGRRVLEVLAMVFIRDAADQHACRRNVREAIGYLRRNRDDVFDGLAAVDEHG